MTSAECLYMYVNDLASTKETAHFEYEGIFEEEAGSIILKTNFTLYYKSKKLFVAGREEVEKIQPEEVGGWLIEKTINSNNSDIFRLKWYEEELKKLFFQKRLKDERLLRNSSSPHYSKSLEKSAQKELKAIVKKIDEQQRRVNELKRYSAYVQAVFHLRNQYGKEKEAS